MYHLLTHFTIYFNSYMLLYPVTFALDPLYSILRQLRLLLQVPTAIDFLFTTLLFQPPLLTPAQIQHLRLIFLHLYQRPILPLQRLQALLWESRAVRRTHTVDLYPDFQQEYVSLYI